MKVHAPFHVGEEWGGDWILFAFRLELARIDRAEWGYWRVQRLASQAGRLGMMLAQSRWARFRRRKKPKNRGTGEGTQNRAVSECP